jgi:hypothetical protein
VISKSWALQSLANGAGRRLTARHIEGRQIAANIGRVDLLLELRERQAEAGDIGPYFALGGCKALKPQSRLTLVYDVGTE